MLVVIKDFPNYMINENGKIYNKHTKKHLKTNIGSPYCRVNLRKNNRTVTKYVHRLVAEAFIPNPNNYPDINHKDLDKTNNHTSNLEWCNEKQNIKHAIQILGNWTENNLNLAKILYAKNIVTNEILKFESQLKAKEYFGYEVYHRKGHGKYLNLINSGKTYKNWLFYN